MPDSAFESPRLLADIGGTYARFTLETAPGVFVKTESLRCADYPDFHAAVSDYLSRLDMARIQNAALAIANPVAGDQVRMTNYHWQFSIEEMRAKLRLDSLVVVNDFTALAMALPSLLPNQCRQIGGGEALPRSVVGLLGAGSGLGVSGLIPAENGWIALGTEGGHTSFSPRNERELVILRYGWTQFSHVSFERLLSGPGLELIYRALADDAGDKNAKKTAPDITRLALANADALCAESLEIFCAILGTAAANLAVTQGAFGGIYIGGGIVPQLGSYFDRSPFRARFEDKGRFSDYMKGIPTYLITATDATFTGVALILSAQLQNRDSAQGTGVLSQLRRARAQLSRAEQQVADHIILHPRAALNDPIAQIAAQAGVSQPTVIRFCRSLGFEGLSDFKLRLASSLTATIPVTHALVTKDDTALELGVKVLANTASAILRARDQLNRDAIDRAVEALAKATRIEFFAVGHYAAVATDAAMKFSRAGHLAYAHTLSGAHALAAQQLAPSCAVVIISGSGSVADLISVAETARARKATVVAITAAHAALAKRADLVLAVDQSYEGEQTIPLVGRILHALMVDTLLIGVQMQRGIEHAPTLSLDALAALDEATPEIAPASAKRTSLGVSTAKGFAA